MKRHHIKDSAGYKWFWCSLCGAAVICPLCGNNCCNGGTRDLPDGSRCGCESAYAHQSACINGGSAPTKDQFPDSDEPTDEDVLMKQIFATTPPTDFV